MILARIKSFRSFDFDKNVSGRCFYKKKVLKFNRKKISEERGNFELNFELDTNEKKARKTFFFSCKQINLV